MLTEDFPVGSMGKESFCSVGVTGDAGLLPGLGRSAIEGNGNALQDSCLGNSMDRRARQVTVQIVTESRTQLSN